MRHAMLVTTIVLSMAAAGPARACWDGELGTIGDVTYMGGRVGWDADRARELATWLARLDAVLPDDASLMIEWDFVSLCRDGACDDWRWDGRSFAALFREVSRRSGAAPASIRRARGLTTPVHTVQVAALSDRARAEALAQRITEAGAGAHGFYETGGFPADNPVAHVISGSDAQGREVHRVLVGAFVDRREATASRDRLEGQLGLRGMVRAL